MGAITNKIFELLSEGSNIEQSRSTGIIISSHWFEAVYREDYEHRGTNGDEQGTTKAGKGDKVKNDPTIQSGGD